MSPCSLCWVIPHLRGSAPHLPLHCFALSAQVHLWQLNTFCLLPHSSHPNPFPIIVQSPHLYFKSEIEEAPERTKRFSTIPFPSLSGVLKYALKSITWSSETLSDHPERSMANDAHSPAQASVVHGVQISDQTSKDAQLRSRLLSGSEHSCNEVH